MHKTMIGTAAGLALLVTASLTWDANATILATVGTPLALPIQTVACWCGWLGGLNGSTQRRSILPMLL